MFTESAGSRKTLGDVDVVFHDGLYHLFHLVLPNHDFIAHAVSENALNWRRVENALFIGHPGSWDDLMLWTMHVSPDPNQDGSWRMFYTGLSRRDQGMIQRIGMACSDDLFAWKKSAVCWHDRRGTTDPERVKRARKKSEHLEASCLTSPIDESSSFPLTPSPKYYESSLDEGRHWVSFRDPFYYRDNGEGYLLMAARVNDGPVVRRGCVGVMEETAPNVFESRPALHHPGLYDDIEVPNLIKIEDDYYLIGSLREDAKIRYWHTSDLSQPWRSYHDNVLLAKGNYAGRICKDEKGLLLWNFFTEDDQQRNVNNIMPPPKRLMRCENGQLRARTFEAFDELLINRVPTQQITFLKPNPHCNIVVESETQIRLTSEAGYQAYMFPAELSSFRLSTTVHMTGLGKCGVVFLIDPETEDGYYLSLDLTKGVAQLRAWGTGPEGSGEKVMQFRSLQAGFWHSDRPEKVDLVLLCFGSYIELTINGNVILSLADRTFESGKCGFYVETADLCLSDLQLNELASPMQSDQHLASG
jgi:beta-fructofuranosidase